LKKKFLIIRFSSIGDIVLTTPVVRCLKNQFQEAEIHYLTKRRNLDLLEANPYIDKIHLFGDSLTETIQELKAEKYDYVIDLHNNLRSLRVKLGLKVKSFSFNKLNIRKLLLTKFRINTLPKSHIVDRNLQTLSYFNIMNDGKGLDHFIPDEDEFPLSQLPEKFRNGYLVLVLAGTYSTKRMPVEKYRRLISETQLHWKIGNVIDFTGKLRINQSASLVKNSRIVISNDTGLMHIAAAYHKKILSVWGNTSPVFGMYPYMPARESEILEVKGLSCHPCSKIGYHKCPKKHFRCMNDIPEDRIIEWVKREF